jgi:hypothetical protein
MYVGTNKTDGHDIPEILLKVALNTITPVFTTKGNSLVLGYLRMTSSHTAVSNGVCSIQLQIVG